MGLILVGKGRWQLGKKYQIDEARLCCMIDTSRWVMKFFREERVRGVRALAGSRYSQNASFKKVYVNLISLYTKIVGRSLFSKNPRVMLSTFEKDQKPQVAAAETWMNHELVRQNFAGTMQRLVTDGLFNIGIAKVGIATASDAANSAWNLKAGDPFLSRVDLDDFVFDHRARDFDEVRYMGNRYRVPLEQVKDNPNFSKKARDKVQATYDIAYNREGDERIGQIGRADETYYEDLEDMVDLWDVYLPQHRCIKTYTESDLTGPGSAWEKGQPVALEEKDWVGHDRGPYPILAYEILPGNIFPKGPVLDLLDLHEASNEGYRKLVRQAARLKVQTAYSRNNPADAEEIRKNSDGDFVGLSSPESVKEIVHGGLHAGLHQITLEFMHRFMEQAGNLTTMGGLAPQAGTLGQEELLAQQSNGQVASMQDATAAFVSDCCDRMLWYYWNHPRLVMKTQLSDPNLPDVNHVLEVHPWNAPAGLMDPRGKVKTLMRRAGAVPELKIDPYSMRHVTPQQRAKDLTQIVTQIYVPLAQVAQQQGVAFNFPAFLGIMGKYLDAPDLQTILSIQAPPEADGNSSSGGGSEGPSGPANTSREYIRRDAGPTQRAEKMKEDNDISAMASMTGGSSNGKPRNMMG